MIYYKYYRNIENKDWKVMFMKWNKRNIRRKDQLQVHQELAHQNLHFY